MIPCDIITYVFLMFAGANVLYLEYVVFPRKGHRSSAVMKAAGIVLIVINLLKLVMSFVS